MASSLLERLNELKNKTPDQIVTALTTRGWMLPSHMGEAYFQANRQVPHVICLVENGVVQNPQRHWRFDSCVGAGGSYRMLIDRLETCVYRTRNNEKYWIKPESEFQQGDYPPCTT